MKYYIYISDTKIDMLYPQIPQPILKRIASSLSINLKLLGAEISIGSKNSQANETRYAKVRIVSEYIEKHLDVGTIDTPSTYFKGTLPMRWEQIGDSLVYFMGTTSRTCIALGGSFQHVIGANISIPSLPRGSNDINSLLTTISGYIDIAEGLEPGVISKIKNITPHSLFSIAKMKHIMTGPEQRIEFLVKTLLQGSLDRSIKKEHGIHLFQSYIVLGTPIYVAIDD